MSDSPFDEEIKDASRKIRTIANQLELRSNVTTIEHEAKKVRKRMDALILATPTGELRLVLTDAALIIDVMLMDRENNALMRGANRS